MGKKRRRGVISVKRGVRIVEREVVPRRLPPFLSTGWWIIHLLGIAGVYTLGHLLWR